jgi:phosphate transport system permease protein
MATVTSDAVTARRAVEARLRGGRADIAGIALQVFLLLSLVISLGILVILLTDIFVRALPAFAERGTDLLSSPLSARPARAGMIQGIIGSLVLTAFVIVIALPLGVGAAVYLEEYARDTRLTRFFRTNVRNLAGVPSIVYGLLGLAVFVTLLGLGQSAIAGGLTLGILVLPIIVITTSEALRAVPISIREAAFGVGATRWEMIRAHVLPYAAPGVLTGTILALARAFGETAPLIMVGAVVGTFNNLDPLEMLTGSYTALPTIIFNWAREPQEEFRALTAAAVVVLLVVILLVNAAAILLRNRYDRRW